MIDKVFPITGNKISYFIIDESSLKFSSQGKSSYSEFQEAWSKKLSIATKVEIKYDTIKSIKKEENDDDISIKYKSFVGISTDCVFSFKNPDDAEIFFDYFMKQMYYQKRNEILSPFRAVRDYVIGLIFTIGFTIFAYYEAIAIANGTVEEAHSGKTRIFNYIIGLVGDKGVIAVGVALASYLGYKIWTRYKNPPNQLQLLPPS